MCKLLKYNSISKKLAGFLAVMLTLQCALFVVFLLFGGTLERLDQNALDILCERVSVRRDYLETEMIQRWSNLDHAQELIGVTVTEFLAQHQLTTADLIPGNPNTSELLQDLVDPLINMLRSTATTGVFLILQGEQPLDRPPVGESYVQAGLYFRDMDPMTIPANHSDIMVERGSPDILRNTNFPMDVNWKPAIIITQEDNLYFEPIQAALTHPNATARDSGYWSHAFRLTDDNVPVISYSQPLRNKQGVPYGILGVEISSDYLYRLLPAVELTAEKTGAYIMGTALMEKNAYVASVASGGTAKRVIDNQRVCRLSGDSVYPSVYLVAPKDSKISTNVYASVQPLTLYNWDSPFYDQAWVLIGLIDSVSLFALSSSIANGILCLAFATFVGGIAIACLAGHIYTKPIRSLAQRVRHLDPTKPVVLRGVEIKEIDDLATSIERLSERVATSSARVSRIIELSGVPLAAFELNHMQEEPLYTKNLFELIGVPVPAHELTSDQLRVLLNMFHAHRDEEMDAQHPLFRIPTDQGGYRWIREKTVERAGSTLGILTDATEEIMEKRRLEYERDYDLLTNLLNRRSFFERLERLQRHPDDLKIGAMLMFDLDNLKYLNDTYGHDCGDRYIRCAADVLRGFGIDGDLAARISGDEFFLFLSGYDGRSTLLPMIRQLQDAIASANIILPNGQMHRLRASMGIAWYPDDSQLLSELVRYADFAMYEAKNAAKGGSRNFNLITYRRDAFLLYSHEELNRILDEQSVDYAFQPIVSCKDGAVMGYEALMRPRSKVLSSPFDVLRIARAQSKLPHIEKLTWFRAMESFVSLPEAQSDCLVFINSVSSQILPEDDLEQFIETFRPYLNRMVIELTESDEQNTDATAAKQRICCHYGIRLALDDFGTGYNNDSVLLTLHPDLVKADMSIIRGIDKDRVRQTMFSNLVSLCQDLEVQVIAEGVETLEELRTVIALGADYIQGYYTGKPTLSPAPANVDIMEEIRAVHRQLCSR